MSARNSWTRSSNRSSSTLHDVVGEDLKAVRNERILASSVLEFEGDDLWREIGKGEMSLKF